MRTSSLRMTTLALAASLVVTAAAPIAEARASRTPSGTPSVIRQAGDTAARAAMAVRVYVSRFFGVSGNGLPQPPLPNPDDPTLLTTEDTTTTTTKTSKKP